jgi:hypothetical protein
MFEQNNIGVRMRNPIGIFIETLGEEDVRIPQLMDAVQCIYDMMDEEGMEQYHNTMQL